MNSDVRCPSCPVDAEPAEDSYQVVGQRKGRTLYMCSTCGTRFETPSRTEAKSPPEAVKGGEPVWTPAMGLEAIGRMLEIETQKTALTPTDSQKASETRATPPTKAHESVTRVSEEQVNPVRRRRRASKVSPELLTPATNERSDPEPIDLHSDVGWVYPRKPGDYHFHWEPPDVGQEPLSKWRRNWNETRNMIKYFRLVNDPVFPKPPSREKGPSKAHRGLDELRELKPTEPDAL